MRKVLLTCMLTMIVICLQLTCIRGNQYSLLIIIIDGYSNTVLVNNFQFFNSNKINK